MVGDMNNELIDFISKVEKSHFRTEHDTGANYNALFIWNLVRMYAGLERLHKKKPSCMVH